MIEHENWLQIYPPLFFPVLYSYKSSLSCGLVTFWWGRGCRGVRAWGEAGPSRVNQILTWAPTSDPGTPGEAGPRNFPPAQSKAGVMPPWLILFELWSSPSGLLLLRKGFEKQCPLGISSVLNCVVGRVKDIYLGDLGFNQILKSFSSHAIYCIDT